MKILAVRLAGVGRFADPVAIEDLSGGLDVLAGPNEMGKSTIFRALRELFTTRHKAAAQAVRRLVPDGSACGPLVEADFAVGGRRYRITKRFHKTQRAELRDLEGDSLLARGAEADDELARLIGLTAGQSGRIGMLWIGQTDALGAGPPAFDGDARSSLIRAVEAEVAGFTGGGLAARVRARVSEALDEQVTSRGPKRGGAYDRLLREREELSGALGEAEAVARLTEERRLAYADARARMDALSAPERREALRKTAADRGAALAEARKSREDLIRTRDRLRQQQAEAKMYQDQLQDLSGASDRLAAASLERAELRAKIAESEQALADATAAREICREQGELAAAEERHWRVRLDRAALAVKLMDKTRVLAAAQKLDAEIAERTRALTSDPATNLRLAALEEAVRDATLAEDRLRVQSAEVAVSYVARPTARIEADGRTLSDGERLRVTGPLALEIAGIGRIDIQPGTSSDRQAVTDRLDHARREAARLLSEIGVADLSAARAAHARRKAGDEALHAAIVQLRAIAPDGVATLVADVSELGSGLASMTQQDSEGADTLDPDAPDDPASIEARLRAMTVQVTDLRRRYSTLSSEREVLAGTLGRLRTDAAGREASIGELARLLGPEADRQSRLKGLAQQAAAASDAVRETALILSALDQAAPDETTLDELSRAASEASRAMATFEAETASLRERLAQLSGELTVADEAGTGLRVAELRGALARVGAELTRVEDDIAGLRLLDEALNWARQEASSRITEPVARRLVPYLGKVLGEAEMEFDSALLPVALRRGVVRESLAQLSQGTQEQLAILTRLAYARLLAETGEAAPVILDDPFAYSDEDRIARMFEVLAEAAAVHQVIVLTCREELFTPMAGKRARLQSWQPPSL